MEQYLRRIIRFFRHLSRRKFIHFLFFPVVFLWDEFFLRVFNNISLFSNAIYPILFAISAGLFCSAVTSLFRKKINRRITIVLLFVTAFFFGMECIIKNTFQVYMDIFAILGGSGNVAANYGSEVASAIFGSIPIIIIYLIPLILYVWRGKKQMPASRYHPLFAIILLILCLIIGGVAVLMASNFKSVSGKYKGQFEYDTATQTFGLLTSTRLDLRYGLFGNKAAEQLTTTSKDEEEEQSDEKMEKADIDYGSNVMDIDFDKLAQEATDDTFKEMDEYVESLTPSNKNEYTGLFEGKNLIIITAEAFSEQVISEELTPTLYRLVNKGINFTDFYQPAWGGSTTTGEYSILLGLVPTNGEESMMDTIGDNMYFTMGNQLQRAGYKCMAFHNGSYDYYNRDKTHKNLGFDDFLAWGNGLEDLLTAWSEDPETFEATLPLYDEDEPFYAYYMSYSGHCAYTSDHYRTQKNLDRVKEVLGDSYKDTTLYYFCYQLELEYALETMVDTLEEKGIADDTVIVLCTDHYPYGLAESSTFHNTEDYLLDLYKTDSYDEFLRDKTACIIWSESIENMNLEVDTPTMSLDILPTLSNLFGLEYDSRLLAGRDVFSDEDPLVLWMNQSFKTEKGTYDAATGDFTPNEGEEVDDDYVDDILTIVSNRISFSKQVVKNDYYGYLFGEDDVTSGEEQRASTGTSSSARKNTTAQENDAEAASEKETSEEDNTITEEEAP